VGALTGVAGELPLTPGGAPVKEALIGGAGFPVLGGDPLLDDDEEDVSSEP